MPHPTGLLCDDTYLRHLPGRTGHPECPERLMAIRDEGDAIVVTTTDVHLAHAIGAALFKSYRGTLHAPWAQEGDLLRVSWER